MNVRRAAVGAAAAVALATSLSGCEVTGELAAMCWTEPPAPHQEYGFVSFDLEVPPRVAAGSQFTIRVDHMVGYPYNSGPGQYPSGTLALTGAVSPSGQVSVGPGLFGGEPYPETLTYTATGQPGDTIHVLAVGGGSAYGTFPDLLVASCSTGGDGTEVATIRVT